MKVKELESLIKESVKKSLAQKYQNLNENVSLVDDNHGFDVGPKVKQAVRYAVECAAILSGVKQRPQGETGSTLSRCFDQILSLFVEPSGELAYPVDSNDLKDELLSQLSKEVADVNDKVGKAASLILDKAVDKINAHMNETMFAEAMSNLEVPTDPNWFDTVASTDSSEFQGSGPKINKNRTGTRVYIEMFKDVLKANRNKLRLDNFDQLVDDFSYEKDLDSDTAWEIAHIALEELQDANLLESLFKTKRPAKRKE
jgi:hypothetical protein